MAMIHTVPARMTLPYLIKIGARFLVSGSQCKRTRIVSAKTMKVLQNARLGRLQQTVTATGCVQRGAVALQTVANHGLLA